LAEPGNRQKKSSLPCKLKVTAIYQMERKKPLQKGNAAGGGERLPRDSNYWSTGAVGGE